MKRFFPAAAIILFTYTSACAQENYEIQVYPSETMDSGKTIVELHSNYTLDGTAHTGEVRPTNKAFHETIEITHGFNSWFEFGFYVFTNYHPDYGMQWVGDHIRPRVRVPESWNWPVGASLSLEVGYQRKEYSENTWSTEIRPIIDKDFKWAYFSFNPVLGRSLKGLNENEGFSFEPCFKVAFHAGKKFDIGSEYYGSTGPLSESVPIQLQEHALYAVIDLFLSDNWELNFGMGWGLTDFTDSQVIKLILGRRF
jgi:hypothetical protein